MKTKIYQFSLIISMLMLLTFLGCGNKKTDTNTTVEKDITQVSETNTSSLPESESPTFDLERAKMEGKTVFLLITGMSSAGNERAISVVKEANIQVSNSLIVRLDKDKDKNKDLVSKFQIASIPVPYILVISPKGIPVVGALPSQVTADQLVKTIPSPKQDEVIFALSEKKPVFIVVSKNGYTDKKETLVNCKAASSKINTKPSIVEIDFDDNKEKTFLSQIGVPTINGKTVTIVINPAGQITEIFAETPSAEKITAAANKIIQNRGCSPGACAPNGCN